MADRIVIMKAGVVQQVGKPMELYDHPVNKFCCWIHWITANEFL